MNGFSCCKLVRLSETLRVSFAAIGSEQLAIGLLSGILEDKGHETAVAFNACLFHDRSNLEIPWLSKYFDDRALFIKELKDQNPEVICFSCITSTFQWAIAVAEEMKTWNPDIKTIFGGVHVSAIPDRVIEKAPVDYVVAGEGEIAIQKIIDRIATGNTDPEPIENTRFKLDGEVVVGRQSAFFQELDTLPWFNKEIWENYLPMTGKYMTMASRGCPYRCTFCFNNFFAELPETKKKGKYVRFRSVDHVLAELKWAIARYGDITFIDFQDDVFTANKKWLREFSERYRKEIGIPFQCLTHPKYMDEETAQLVSKAGCKWIQMGVQSMDEDFKNKHLLRYERSDNIREACRVMNKYGIRAKLDHMFGLPGEPLSAQAKALDLYREYVPSRIQTFWTCYLPGTDMMNEALENGTLSQEEAERLYEGDDFHFYRIGNDIVDSEKHKYYNAYEFIFKILPSLPKRLRLSIQPEHVFWIPKLVRKPIMFTADLVGGLRYRNPDFVGYLIHNLFHLKRFFFWKFFGKVITANSKKNAGISRKTTWSNFNSLNRVPASNVMKENTKESVKVA